MNSDAEQRTAVVRYWWSKADAGLLSARRELKAGALEFSVNRLYYAMFYAVTAVFLNRQMAFSKHSGVRAAFHREIIKKGLMDVKWGKLYDQLFEDRQEGDYMAMVVFDKQYVESQLVLCTEFLEKLRPLSKTDH